MTLTTHALAGAIAAQVFPQKPALAFAAGFLSHFLLDFIPHWDYKLSSFVRDPNEPLNNDMALGRNFLLDLLRTGFDAFLGVLLSYFIFSYYLGVYSWEIALLGAAGGLFPDFLQLVYFKTRMRIFIPLQRFHHWIQAGKSLHIDPVLGIFLQVLTLVIFFVLVGIFTR